MTSGSEISSCEHFFMVNCSEDKECHLVIRSFHVNTFPPLIEGQD